MNRPLLHIVRSLDPAQGGPAELVRQLIAAHAVMGIHSEVTALDTFHGHGKYGWAPSFTHWLRARAADYECVFIHGLWQWQGLGTWQALRGTTAHYFLFPHGMLDPWFREAFPWRHARKVCYWKLFEQRVVRDAAAIIFTSEDELQRGRTTFQPWLARHEAVVSLGTTAPPRPPEELRQLLYARFPQLRGERLLLFLGRLHPKKGCDLLLEAFRRVTPPLHLVFAGPCEDARLVAELRVRAEGLRVTFTGPLYGEDKWAALAAAEVFALPSHQENFGVAVAEALASGVPVLVSQRVNIWREIVEDGAGMAESDDLEGTTRLLERWLAADHDAMRLAAQRCFAARFDIRRTAENLLALISQRP